MALGRSENRRMKRERGKIIAERREKFKVNKK